MFLARSVNVDYRVQVPPLKVFAICVRRVTVYCIIYVGRILSLKIRLRLCIYISCYLLRHVRCLPPSLCRRRCGPRFRRGGALGAGVSFMVRRRGARSMRHLQAARLASAPAVRPPPLGACLALRRDASASSLIVCKTARRDRAQTRHEPEVGRAGGVCVASAWDPGGIRHRAWRLRLELVRRWCVCEFSASVRS